MYKLCKTEQSAMRQREIENVLFETLKKKNYEDITITELCEKLNMPRKAFYRYFDGKDSAVTALIEHKMLEYDGFGPAAMMEKRTINKEIERFFTFWYENRELLETLEKNGLLSRIFESAVNFPIKDFISMTKYLPDDSDWAKERIFRFATCGLMFEAVNWYKDGFKTSVSDMAEICCRMLKQPLFPNLDKFGTL
ncbi:MAG: TetR/AcrR family transcriptional regulator [Ruminococcaceae bacterium]|nr:TetR/AcrR family transcriptional regulator [Oscillospiraceae bacterium]